MKKLNVRLLRTIRESKGQFISVAVIVALAICIYISFSMTAINMEDSVDYYYDTTKSSDIHLQLVKMPKGAVNELNTIEGVEKVQGRISFDVPLRVNDEGEKVRIRIISVPKNENINTLYIIKGHNIKKDIYDIVLLEQFAKARNIKLKDEITPYINGKTYNLDVIGIAASSEYVYLMENEQSLLPAEKTFGVGYVSEEFAQSAYGYKGSYNELLIKVKDENKIDEIADTIEKKLDKYGVKRVIKKEDQLSNKVLTDKIEGINKMSSAIPILFLIVAAVIISIMISRIVKNDRTVIGVLKALGYNNLSILSHYIKYALGIGIIGALGGIISGIFLSNIMSSAFIQFFNIPIFKLRIYYIHILYSIFLTSVFCIASGFMGARPVLNIMPADSMRPEAPKDGKRIFIEKIGFIWKKIKFSWKMVIRNISRSKKRFTFLVLGLALTYGINTVPVFQSTAINSVFSLQYGEFQTMDYTIDFVHPMNEQVIKDLKNIIDTDKIEPKLEYPFEITNGWRKKTVSIIGVPKDTSFYEFKDKYNKKVSLQEEGLFITEILAQILDVKEGDKVLIKNFIPGKSDVTIKINGIIKQHLGSNIYMDIKLMEELLIEKQMITGVSLDSEDDVEEKLKNVKNISSIKSISDMKNSFKEFLDSVIYTTGVYMVFGGILGFAIIYNSTIISISERSMEFSSLRVMGFDKKDIYWMIAKENFIMTIVAILIGIPIGLGMQHGIAKAFNTEMITLPVIIRPQTFIIAAIATIIFVIIAQLATLKKIYNLNFIDALKNRIS